MNVLWFVPISLGLCAAVGLYAMLKEAFDRLPH